MRKPEKGMDNPRGYVTTVAVNAMKRLLRRAAVQQLAVAYSGDEDADDPPDAYLRKHHGDHPVAVLERAAGSEDAFDAAVSALIMPLHVDELDSLQQAPADAPQRREGAIWVPRTPVEPESPWSA